MYSEINIGVIQSVCIPMVLELGREVFLEEVEADHELMSLFSPFCGKEKNIHKGQRVRS